MKDAQHSIRIPSSAHGSRVLGSEKEEAIGKQWVSVQAEWHWIQVESLNSYAQQQQQQQQQTYRAGHVTCVWRTSSASAQVRPVWAAGVSLKSKPPWWDLLKCRKGRRKTEGKGGRKAKKKEWKKWNKMKKGKSWETKQNIRTFFLMWWQYQDVISFPLLAWY